MKNNHKYFWIGLIVYYLIISLAPSKLFYFSAYLITPFFFYLSNRDIRLSLLFSLVLSLFSEIALAGSLFLMEPEELKMGSGWWFTPMTMILIILLPFVIKKKISNLKYPDYFIFLFIIFAFISCLIFPYRNSLLGLVALAEVILVYFSLRTFLTAGNLKYVYFLIISMLVFQSGLGILQQMQGKPVGILAEAVSIDRPYGITAVEEAGLFRISGTYGHPNLYAACLLVLIPFVLFGSLKSIQKLLLFVLSYSALFFTYSRIGWVGGIFYLFIFIVMNIKSLFKSSRIVLPTISVLIFIIILLFPLIQRRIASFYPAFEEFGSMGVRLKLFTEAFGLIIQYPFTGVGLNRSLETYTSSPVTDLFYFIPKSGFYRIHNTLLEISAELGVFGLLLFILFVFSTIREYIIGKKEDIIRMAIVGFIGLLFIAMFNPLLYSSVFRLFFLLSAIILV